MTMALGVIKRMKIPHSDARVHTTSVAGRRPSFFKPASNVMI